jgi:hypothetical protein
MLKARNRKKFLAFEQEQSSILLDCQAELVEADALFKPAFDKLRLALFYAL